MPKLFFLSVFLWKSAMLASESAACYNAVAKQRKNPFFLEFLYDNCHAFMLY